MRRKATATLYNGSPYPYVRVPYPHPGTGNFAFRSPFPLPLFKIQAGGFIPLGGITVTEVPPMQAQLGTFQAGYTGIVAGQMILQPLVDPNAGTSSAASY